MTTERLLLEYYQAMLDALGPGDWWPAGSPFEVAVGAVLTQNTNWKNVEKALALLHARAPMTPAGLWRLPLPELEECLRPSGYYRVKAQRLKALLEFMAQAAGSSEPPDDQSLAFLRDRETEELRQHLLLIKGVGPETADAILLYALERPIFVVDAYTQRIFHRHGLVPEEISYHELQGLFMDALEPDTAVFNEYHSLIVRLGKDFCKKQKPLCASCPLRPFLEYEPLLPG